MFGIKRIRLLPVVIFIAASTASLKVGSLLTETGPAIGNQAIAQDQNAAPSEANKTENAAAANPEETQEETEGKAVPSPIEPEFDPTRLTDAELDILQKLADRRAELSKRSEQLDTREQLLLATERRLEIKIRELARMQETIRSLLKQHDKEKEAQMRSVVKIYEKMKPKKAAQIFEQLDIGVLLDVIERMKESRTAPIMAQMSPARAKTLTSELAKRRSLPEIDKSQAEKQR